RAPRRRGVRLSPALGLAAAATIRCVRRRVVHAGAVAASRWGSSVTMSDVDAGPDAPPDARLRPPWVVVIALLAVLAVVAVLVGRCASGDGDGATPVPSTL